MNCVCVVEKAGWEIESWTEPGDLGELKADFSGWHGDIQTLIEAADQNSLYKWALFDRPPMPSWGQGRVTLRRCLPPHPAFYGARRCHGDRRRCCAISMFGSRFKYSSRVKEIRRFKAYAHRFRSKRIAPQREGISLKRPTRLAKNRAARKASSGAMDKIYGYNA